MSFAACVAVAGGLGLDRIASAPPDELVQALQRHRLVARSERYAEWMTPAQTEVLRPLWRIWTAWALAQVAEAERLPAALGRAGVPAVVFKGIALQRFLHGSTVGRDAVDVDLLVPEGALGDAARVLVGLGYRLGGGLDLAAVASAPLTEVPLVHPELRVHLDLHQRLFARHLALDAAEAAIRERAGPSGLNPLAMGLMVGVTGGKDVWKTLRHLADLADLEGRVDLGELARLADRTRTRGLLDAGFALVGRVLGRPSAWSSARPVRVDLAAVERALRGPRRDGVSWMRLRTYLAARERLSDRVRALARLPFEPARADVLEGGPEPLFVRRTMRLLDTYVLPRRKGG